ncbi:guanine nucleotide exchange factor VPS9 [Aspergillus saccharolyticus JOP 1030-1]|uniref:Guanine nucleotide exchange factor Vps9 n=1 Tax=Aspergillus saccharolyticus JOP 1030-1 TaxID=1450539 RepID=A0A318ZER0_9EURO|nr:guanine nucleotide exchange factor Vps9 [Aspergillus saccharolyticus JOP 1030-1]PYH42090.1 guanine nucleotide exchange factor Vps9 [Aspergillus saccharolyticus JOP 1030-1]
MSATEPSECPASPSHGEHQQLFLDEASSSDPQVTATGPESAAQSQNGNSPKPEEPQPINMNQEPQLEAQNAATHSPHPPSTPADNPQSLPEKMQGLSIVTTKTPESVATPGTDIPPTPPAKDDSYFTSKPQSAGPARSSTAPLSEKTNKELPEVPGGGAGSVKKDLVGRGDGGQESDSQSEIQSIIDQFQDTTHADTEETIMSPRLELAEQFFGGQSHFPPRQSSLEHSKASPEEISLPGGTITSPEKQSIKSLRESSITEEARLSRRSSTSTIPPPPEPESDQPFDFHRFLEQLRHRTADPVAKFLRSFLNEFGKRQWMAHEQVKIISDFLVFITNKMAQCEVWRGVSDSEFDNAKEGMEKLVMNRLYSQTFSPAIPGPPTIPTSASRSKRRELERMHGPWRRGQHQEDIERDEVLAQKMRIYSWVNETHLDIPPVSAHGRRFLNLAQQELLKINGYRAPRDKVICILNCCKVIFGLLRNSKRSDTSADSFVPLLIYVVLQANPAHLVSNTQYILRFRNQEKLGGEAGYYLSSLSGAIQFIETLDRTSLTVSDEDFERNVEAAVSAIAQQNRESETLERKSTERKSMERSAASSQAASAPRASVDTQRPPERRDTPQPSDEDQAPVAGLLRTIQKPLSTIGRLFSDEPDSPQDRSARSGSPARLTPNVYQPPRNSSEGQESVERPRTAVPPQSTRALDSQDAAARQASAEDAEARRIQRAEHNNVVETLSNMFPNLDRDVIDDVVKMKEGRVGLAVDACLALSAE